MQPAIPFIEACSCVSALMLTTRSLIIDYTIGMSLLNHIVMFDMKACAIGQIIMKSKSTGMEQADIQQQTEQI